MKLLKLGMKRAFFKVLAMTDASQAAVMVLAPGQTTGKPDNEHPGAEQWLFVVSGQGKAVVGQRHVELASESLLLVERDEVHQIVNDGRAPLVTVNFYVPPAYRLDDEVRHSVRK